MIKDILANSEPIAYKTLRNSLMNNKVAHSYLFSGEYNPLKIETAYLLAQSIVEDKGDFACEECSVCKRIRNNSYFDVIYVDGYKETIKKVFIENILSEFSRTSLESSGKKVYILANINNSSDKVLNMVLKFMEEPSSENTYGIFISDNKDDLLPTIVSRCQNIPFMTRDFSFLMDQYIENGFDETDAYLLSDILHKYDPEFDLNDEAYINARDYAYKTIENLDDPEYLPVLFSLELYSYMKDKKDMARCADYYLDIMIRMVSDALENKTINDNEYNKYLKTLGRYDLIKLLEIFESGKEKANMNAERRLLLDSVIYHLINDGIKR